ncbi:ATPase with strong ADP affinity [Crenothrix polyspora]|uniref:tRNA threonylcarbamoyladenosine biosynthesis protein TsaE n=1 Tax=Crenothrix polyspora TaxID=360316 RepID=A0A1R4H8L8_9GAMM|nr:tRNA (adenosine(37)-N6)-threonylcarbamoyltransferase complex ATPase subunit type 1 TsaE [Crenothrix polyspora]SJM92526.1 ATPase with strong ADP affinity [Crenothrix polyspora]
MKSYLATSEDTEQFGAKLWQVLPPKALVFLQGDLGAGKTTLVRGFLRAGGFSGAIKSPTYTLVEEYSIGTQKIFHFDLYRLSEPEELEWIGINDYFDQNSLCFIEWPTKGAGFLPMPDYEISLMNHGSGRQIIMQTLKNL